MVLSFPIDVKTYHASFGPNKVVYYPQVMSLKNVDMQQMINQSIAAETQLLIDRQVAEMPTQVEEMIGSFELKNNQRDVFSLLLSNYTYHHQAAHGMTYIQSLTFDLQEGRRCELHDLFLPGSDYVTRLSNCIREQIQKRDIPVLEPFTSIRPNQDFYIADKTLVVYFQLYELAPYVYGFPMFPISVYDLQSIIRDEGPLGRMAQNQ